ncbi:MAG: MiaB/RimO family radical SAM methylthiotransferase [candidate division WOR-3 bacterium]
MKYFIKAFGCRLNQYYADYFSNAVVFNGNRIVESEFEADVVAIASCVVTHKAERDIRHYVSHVKRINPLAKIVVFGCYPKYRYLEDIYAAGGLSEVFSRLGLEDPGCLIKPIFRVRTNIRVQEGCNFRCSYCIVPFVRGPSKSRSEEEIMKEIKNVVSNGAVEIVLTGIQTGEWGREWGKRISYLIKNIKDQFPELRIRLSSISPIHVKKDVIELLKEGYVLPHLHLPIQHGSEKVLKEMRRPYKLEYYVNLVNNLVAEVRNIAIGTDVIVGFPTETEQDFEESYNLISALPFAYMHVFEFSPREGTPAARLSSLNSEVVRKRKQKLLDLAKEKKKQFLLNQIGKVMGGVVETRELDYYSATGDNYVKIHLPLKYNLKSGQVVKIKVESSYDNFVTGLLAEAI